MHKIYQVGDVNTVLEYVGGVIVSLRIVTYGACIATDLIPIFYALFLLVSTAMGTWLLLLGSSIAERVVFSFI